MNPWHNVKVGDLAPQTVNAVVEVPRGSKIKYELDKDCGLIRVDRILFSSVHYPANYGFIPQTYGEDKDPLDILVLGQESVVPLAIVRASPLGVMKMLDQGEPDDKIIAVHSDDAEFNHIQSLEELPPHRMKEIKIFFEHYKVLENKVVNVDQFFDRDEAFKIIAAAQKRYQKEFPPRP